MNYSLVLFENVDDSCTTYLVPTVYSVLRGIGFFLSFFFNLRHLRHNTTVFAYLFRLVHRHQLRDFYVSFFQYRRYFR